MTLIRDTVDAIRAIPAALVDRINRWVLHQHAPYDVHADGSEATCLTCKTQWPCEVIEHLQAENERLRSVIREVVE